jgi:hypothetical protein
VSDYDINNLRRRAPNANVSYVATSVNLDPITVALSGGAFAIPEAAGPAMSYSKGNAGIRVSGNKIADIVTFDVIYKISGADPNTDTNKLDPPKQGEGPQPDGRGAWNNAFGLYANIDVLDGLGLGVGYSGLFAIHEDEEIENVVGLSDGTYKTVSPWYSGIDLRVAYTGIENLTITFNNNFSFAGATGEDPSDSKKFVASTVSVTNLGTPIPGLVKDQKDSYFGMYNALGVNYKLADNLTARAEIANRLGTYTFDDDGDKYEGVVERLRIVLSANYTANSHVGFEGGLAFQIDHTSAKAPADIWWNSKEYKGGTFTFGIPLRLHVVF